MRRFLFLLLVFVVGDLSAQAVRYVYARSGLTLRATPATDGRKVAVVPFGASLELTGRTGNSATVELLAAAPGELLYREEPSLPLTTEAPFVEVRYGELTGYVYEGYLCRYPVNTTEDVARPAEGWLNAQGEPDTLVDGRFNDNPIRLMIHWGKDICYRQGYVEGGASTTIILPVGTLQEGYLIANHLYGLERSVRYAVDPESGEVDSVNLLVERTANHLLFGGSNGIVRIEEVGGMVIIYWDWSC